MYSTAYWVLYLQVAWISTPAIFWFALVIILRKLMPSSAEGVQLSKKVLVIGVAVLLFLDFCHYSSSLAIIPSDRRHVLSNLFLGTKIRVRFRSCFEVSDADILAAILFQATSLGSLCETPELHASLEETFNVVEGRGLFNVCRGRG